MSRDELPIASGEAPGPTDDREEEIARLVERFYAVAREDPQLGPVFERHVTDWDEHLTKMRDFWSGAIYRTGRYAGRPLEVHRNIPEIEGEHFDRWLALWTRTVEQVVESEARVPLSLFAGRMAATMRSRMGLDADRGADR